MTRRFSSSASVARLALEALESRFTPADMRWYFPNANNNNWSDSANWQAQATDGSWGPTNAPPGPTDKAIFYSGQTRDISANVAAVGKIEIQAGYTGALILPASSTVTATLLTMGGGTIKSVEGVSTPSLELRGAGSTLTAGTLDIVQLRVGSRDANFTAGTTLTINGDITLKNRAWIYIGAPVANGNPNEVNWQSNNILMPGTTSDSLLYNFGGTLRINSSGQLGDANTTAKTRLLNTGTLEVYGTPTIAGSFENSGTTSVRSAANLTIQGTAKQTAGTTELRSGTITMAANGVYAVDAGSLIGNGTIDGNLTLGTVANGAVSISPGYSGAEIGTLTITKSLHMVSTGTSTTIQVFTDATFDKIVVQGGYAILNGTLTVSLPADYKKPLGTSYTFLTAPTFKAPGGTNPTDFTTKNLTGQGMWLDMGVRVWKLKSVDGSYSVYVGDSMT